MIKLKNDVVYIYKYKSIIYIHDYYRSKEIFDLHIRKIVWLSSGQKIPKGIIL
jgi:hypothetical protein